jgi:hypothetical protein
LQPGTTPPIRNGLWVFESGASAEDGHAFGLLHGVQIAGQGNVAYHLPRARAVVSSPHATAVAPQQKGADVRTRLARRTRWTQADSSGCRPIRLPLAAILAREGRKNGFEMSQKRKSSGVVNPEDLIEFILFTNRTWRKCG